MIEDLENGLADSKELAGIIEGGELASGSGRCTPCHSVPVHAEESEGGHEGVVTCKPAMDVESMTQQRNKELALACHRPRQGPENTVKVQAAEHRVREATTP